MSLGPWANQHKPKFRATHSQDFKRLSEAFRRALDTPGEARARRDLEDFLASKGLGPRERKPYLRRAKGGPPRLSNLTSESGDGAY